MRAPLAVPGGPLHPPFARLVHFYLTIIGWVLALLLVLWVLELVRRKRGTMRVKHYSFPRQWLGWIEDNVPVYKRLPWDLRAPLQDFAMSFADGKAWHACGGLDTVTDEMKITIAGHACMLMLNRMGPPDYSRFRNVHVYPASYLTPPDPDDQAIGEGDQWPAGAVVVAWDAAKQTAFDLRDRFNPVLGDLWRKLAPPAEHGSSGNDFQFTSWARVICPPFAKTLLGETGRSELVERYGAPDALSFFAVASEVFFESPEHLRLRHQEVYDLLRKSYRLDPARWTKNG